MGVEYCYFSEINMHVEYVCVYSCNVSSASNVSNVNFPIFSC